MIIPKYIDLFAGCGGLSEGFSKTKLFNGVAHVEWEAPMVNTLRNRLIKLGYSEDAANESVIHFDIQKHQELIHGNWGEESVSKYGKTNANHIQNTGLKGLVSDQKVDLIIGGPPCQAYSIAGRKRLEGRNDYRNYLFESFTKVVEAFKPKLFVFENVPGILSAKPDGKPVLDRIYDSFSESGYEILKPELLKEAVYLASDFNVPQSRKRIIIIGVRKDLNWNLADIYAEINKRKTTNTPTVKDAIGHLPKIFPLDKEIPNGRLNIAYTENEDPNVTQHEARYQNRSDIAIFKDWVSQGMNALPSQEKINYYNKAKNKNSNCVKYRSLEWDKPSPTIVAHLHKDGLMFIHPDAEQARTITVREAANLQSFPEDYEFLGSKAYCYKMIGNAVPPNMAEQIALGIHNFLKEQKA